MVPKKSVILAVALALLGASSGAQSRSGKVFARYNRPLKTVSLDLGTGAVTRGPAVHKKSTGTETGFDNIDLGGSSPSTPVLASASGSTRASRPARTART